MGYFGKVLIAIALCFVLPFIASLAPAVRQVVNAQATGIAFVRRGLREALLFSTVLGWVAGTVWHLLTIWNR